MVGRARGHPRGAGAVLRVAVAFFTLLAVAGASTVKAQRSESQPRYGGTITVRDPVVPGCLDLSKLTAGPGSAEEVMAADTLLTSDSHFHTQPNLATGWTISRGGRWITFTLRRGVRFSNGNPFDASAVKFSFDRVLAPGFSTATASLLGPLKQVQVVNKYAVRFVMATPFRPILYAVQFEEFAILEPKATRAVDTCTNPVGTGSYEVQSIGTAFSSITEVPNPYRNWQPGFLQNQGKPYLAKLVFLSIPSDATAISALLSGELDFSDVPGTQLSRVQGDPRFALHRTLEQDVHFLGFNTARTPFNTVGARRAVAEAIDRTSIIKAAVNGLGVPAYSTLAQNIPYFDKSVKADLPAYNPAAAKRYFAAHHITGPFNLLVYDYGGVSTTAEVIQAELAQVGVTVNVSLRDFAGFAPLARSGSDDMFLFVYGDGDADIYSFEWASDQETSTGFNFSYYKNATLDRLIVQGRTSLKPAVAQKVYGKIQSLMNKNAIVVPLWTDQQVYALNKRISGWHAWTTAALPALQDMYLTR